METEHGSGARLSSRSGGARTRPLALAALLAAAAAALVLAAPAAALTVWAVGDGAVAGTEDDALAGRVEMEGIDRLLYLGDVYEDGTAAEYQTNYHPSWGRFKAITSPTPGNHEWPRRAEGYDPYWGDLAPRPAGGHYYSFDLAGWHFVSLNSHQDSSPGSPQVAWLQRDLAPYTGTCTIAFWHRPRYNAGVHSDAEDTEPFYGSLVGRAALVLTGHDHNYQRFRPIRGITQFIVGTGGVRPLHAVNEGDPRLASSNETTLGALRIVLRPDGADYEFVDTGGARHDRGSVDCIPHGTAAPPSVAIASPRPRRYSRRLRRLRGTSTGAVAPVRLRLLRRTRGRCSAFDGSRFRRSSCASRRAFDAAGLERWSFDLPARALRRGRYSLTALVAAADGRSASARVRFRVR